MYHRPVQCQECREWFASGTVHKCPTLTIYDVLRAIISKLNMVSESEMKRMVKAVDTAESSSLFGGAGRFEL